MRPFRALRPGWKAIKRAWRSIAQPADRGYMICATPRCGSNYLSQLLASTGMLGDPREYFNAAGRRKYDDPAYPDDPHEQLKRVLTTGRTSNGIYAVKLHAYQLAGLEKSFDPTKILPHLQFVVLDRRDILRQAISWSRARRTGQIRATDAIVQVEDYDQDDIRRSLIRLMDERSRWEQKLRALKVRPLSLTYESVMRAPQLAVDRVAALMRVGGSPAIDPSRVSVTIQRDRMTEHWYARFLAETGDEFRPLARLAESD
jgi:LPS sulfotransferase NodH